MTSDRCSITIVHYQPAFTSYNVTIDCGVDVGQQMYFGITLYSNNVTEGTSFSPPWSLKACLYLFYFLRPSPVYSNLLTAYGIGPRSFLRPLSRHWH